MQADTRIDLESIPTFLLRWVMLGNAQLFRNFFLRSVMSYCELLFSHMSSSLIFSSY